MELTHDQYYLRKITRDYGENFFSCSGFISCAFSFIVFMITISIYMSFCLIKEDMKHQMEAQSASEHEKKQDLKDKSHNNNQPTKEKQAPSPLNIDPKRPYAALSEQLKDPSLVADLH